MKSLAWCLATAAPLLLTPIPTFAADFFLKKNDKVVMIGDSITEQHLHSTYLECWALTRFPQQNLQFINVGIGGDTAPGGRNRFQRDVLPYAPTILTVNFGMNDAGGPGNQWVEERFKNYRTGLQGIADQSKSANIRVVWFTPQPVEIAAAGPSILPDNLNLEKFSAGVKEIAASNGDDALYGRMDGSSEGLLINVEPCSDRLTQGRPDPLVHLLCQRFSQQRMAGQGTAQSSDSTRVFNQPPHALNADTG